MQVDKIKKNDCHTIKGIESFVTKKQEYSLLNLPHVLIPPVFK